MQRTIIAIISLWTVPATYTSGFVKKTEKDPKCVIFSKNRRFEDIKYDTERGGDATESESQKFSSISRISKINKISKTKSENQRCYLHLFFLQCLFERRVRRRFLSHMNKLLRIMLHVPFHPSNVSPLIFQEKRVEPVSTLGIFLKNYRVTLKMNI